MEWKSHRLRCFMDKTPLFHRGIFIFLFFYIAFALLNSTVTTKATPCPDRIRCQMTSTKTDIYIQEFECVLKKKLKGEEEMSMSKLRKREVSTATNLVSRTRRFLGGPGSWPPRCMSKCGRCAPCKPVHVTVPPGTPVTTEYYPEAWRCKCGNRLFMP